MTKFDGGNKSAIIANCKKSREIFLKKKLLKKAEQLRIFFKEDLL